MDQRDLLQSYFDQKNEYAKQTAIKEQASKAAIAAKMAMDRLKTEVVNVKKELLKVQEKLQEEQKAKLAEIKKQQEELTPDKKAEISALKQKTTATKQEYKLKIGEVEDLLKLTAGIRL